MTESDKRVSDISKKIEAHFELAVTKRSYDHIKKAHTVVHGNKEIDYVLSEEYLAAYADGMIVSLIIAAYELIYAAGKYDGRHN